MSNKLMASSEIFRNSHKRLVKKILKEIKSYSYLADEDGDLDISFNLSGGENGGFEYEAYSMNFKESYFSAEHNSEVYFSDFDVDNLLIILKELEKHKSNFSFKYENFTK